MFNINNFLRDVDNVLVLRNGAVIKNLYDLRFALKYIDSSVFAKHVVGRKNDFVNWVEVEVGDLSLAHSMRSARNETELFRIVDQRIEYITTSMFKHHLNEGSEGPARHIGAVDKIEIPKHIAFPKNERQIEEEQSLDELPRKVVDEIMLIEESLGDARFKRGLLNFIFGLVLGILCGFLIAKVI